MLAESGVDSMLFACTKCYARFPLPQLSKGKQLCPQCAPQTNRSQLSKHRRSAHDELHSHSSSSLPSLGRLMSPATRPKPGGANFVQCLYCKSDFWPPAGSAAVKCNKCLEQESRYGEPQFCPVCGLKMLWKGDECVRCFHYRHKFGMPVLCQMCQQKCAFLKDQSNRDKVDGQTLCWLCTYSYKKRRKKLERDETKLESQEDVDYLLEKKVTQALKQRHPPVPSSILSATSVTHKNSSSYAHSHRKAAASASGHDQMSLINQLQEEVKRFKKQVSEKEAQLVEKERQITELRAELRQRNEEFKMQMSRVQRQADVETESLRKENLDQRKKIARLEKEVQAKRKIPRRRKVAEPQEDSMQAIFRDSAVLSRVKSDTNMRQLAKSGSNRDSDAEVSSQELATLDAAEANQSPTKKAFQLKSDSEDDQDDDMDGSPTAKKAKLLESDADTEEAADEDNHPDIHDDESLNGDHPEKSDVHAELHTIQTADPDSASRDVENLSSTSSDEE